MNTLEPQEISSWLQRVGQNEDPALDESNSRPPITVSTPTSYSACECFVRCFIEQVVEQGELLVVIKDWQPSQPSQDFIHSAIRLSFEDTRPIDEAPGYSFKYSEREMAVAIFTLTCCFKWKCYLYADHGELVLYNWEGEIFDVWASSKSKRDEIRFMTHNFGLKEK
jgi:hypothetical protein